MIQVKNFNYKISNKTLFKEFNFSVNKGEKILITAPSGKGKSTFLKILMGFMHVEDNSIFIDDIPLNKENIKKIRDKLLYLGQETSFIGDTLKEAMENIFSFKANRDKKIDYDKLSQLLKEFNLSSNDLNKNIKSFSG